MKCKRVLVHVRRDMAETIPAIVFCHEVPILQVIHGDSAISVLDGAEALINQFGPEGMDDDEIKRQLESRKKFLQPQEVDPVDEYNRLIGRYGKHADIDVSNVEYCYGRHNSRAWKDALKMTPESLDGTSMDEEPETAEPMARRARSKSAEADAA